MACLSAVAELVRLIAAQLRHRRDSGAAAQAFVDELPVHIGLLDERELDWFRFSHLSFQEFLAARHIAEATEARWTSCRRTTRKAGGAR